MITVTTKKFSSSSPVVLGVRKRPNVVCGGGFVVADTFSQKVVFRVDGYGVLGKKETMILSDGEGTPLLHIHTEGCFIEAIKTKRKWKAYRCGHEGSQKLMFTLKEPHSFLLKNNPIRISISQRECSSSSRDFEIRGNFNNRDCSIIDYRCEVIAQVGAMKEVQKVVGSNDLYHVVIKPGIDQEFILGVIAILDYICDEATISGKFKFTVETGRGENHQNMLFSYA